MATELTSNMSAKARGDQEENTRGAETEVARTYAAPKLNPPTCGDFNV